MDFQLFSFSQLLTLSISGVLFVLSFILFYKENVKWSLFILFLATFTLGLFMGILDQYLNYWDEQYHVLVAKNMMNSPFSPMLYKNDVLNNSSLSWVGCQIWLHKQPLFLWQMALSMNIFGVTPLAARIPSILMHALMLLMIFKIGKNMLGSIRVGYYAAFLFATSNFIIEMVSGYRTCDHNDMAFLFYVTASIWAWTEYIQKPNWNWILLIGLFAGGAVLNKWLPGLLVFGGWGVTILASKTERKQIMSYLHIMAAFGVSVAVFLPWQVYTHLRFPVEASYEYNLNLKHFSMPIENHGGSWNFYFENLDMLYGEGDIMPIALILGLILLLFRAQNNRYRLFVVTSIVSVYGFYSFAATKMYSFPLIVGVFAFVSFALVFDLLHKQLQKTTINKNLGNTIMGILILVYGWLSLNMHSVENFHTLSLHADNGYRIQKQQELVLFDALVKQQPDTATTFFNLPSLSAIPFMFHKTVHAAYDHYPNIEEYSDLKKRRIKMVFVDNHKNDIPEYILKDSTAKFVFNPK